PVALSACDVDRPRRLPQPRAAVATGQVARRFQAQLLRAGSHAEGSIDRGRRGLSDHASLGVQGAAHGRWRRGWDSNPRSFRSTVFKTVAITRWPTSPWPAG